MADLIAANVINLAYRGAVENATSTEWPAHKKAGHKNQFAKLPKKPVR
jgi:hypothetical protein